MSFADRLSDFDQSDDFDTDDVSSFALWMSGPADDEEESPGSDRKKGDRGGGKLGIMSSPQAPGFAGSTADAQGDPP